MVLMDRTDEKKVVLAFSPQWAGDALTTPVSPVVSASHRRHSEFPPSIDLFGNYFLALNSINKTSHNPFIMTSIDEIFKVIASHHS